MKSPTEFILQNAKWASLLFDSAGLVRSVNDAAVALFGDSLKRDKPELAALWSTQNEIPFEQFLVHVEQAGAVDVNLKLRIKSGTTQTFKSLACFYAEAGHKFFLLQIIHEAMTVTEPTSVLGKGPPIEANLAHKQKLDCALQLIRNVSLDFNNALTSVLGHTSLLLAQMPHANPWRTSLFEIEKSAERAAEIASDLASFSRQEKDTHGNLPGNLNQVLRRTVELYQAPGSPQITWTLQLENRLYTANFDEAKLQQAFMKLFDNAIQSPGRDRRIQVVSSNRSLSEPIHVGAVALSPGHYVYVEISDNGAGIPQDILPRVFEPFFTTKPGHRGLGLAWVYGIITNHRGIVTVSNKEDGGTTVAIYLPARKKIARDDELHDHNLTGNQTILIVDDEEVLLTMEQMILSAYGYRVLIANSGEKALEIFRNSAAEIDLVITDLVMPHMSGRELSERLQQLSQHTRIVCTSGYSRPNQPEAEDSYLQKPFTSQDLLRKVKTVLS